MAADLSEVAGYLAHNEFIIELDKEVIVLWFAQELSASLFVRAMFSWNYLGYNFGDRQIAANLG